LANPTPSRRGIATVLATLLFVFIAFLVFSNLYMWYFNELDRYNEVVEQMNQRDIERLHENIEISNVLFGGKATYTATPFTTPYSATSTTGHDYPLLNSDFTYSVNYWSLTKEYPPGVDLGASGAWDSAGAGMGSTGSRSGPGVIFSDVNYQPDSGKVTFVLEWAGAFYIDLDEYGGQQPGSVKFSYGRFVPPDLWTSASDQLVLTVWLRDSAGNNITQIGNTVTYKTGGDESWVYTDDVPVTGVTWADDSWYNIVLRSEITMKAVGGGATPSQTRIYFDDVYLDFAFSAYVATTDIDVQLSENRDSITKLEISYTGAYSSSVTQRVSIYDFSSSRWVLVKVSKVSTTPITVNFTYEESDIKKFINPENNAVRIRIYAISSSTFNVTHSSLSITDFYRDTSKLTLTLSNQGDYTAHIVSLWIIDSTGHHRQDLDIYLSPGESKSVDVNYNWVVGKYILKVVTERGNISYYVTTT